MTIKEEAKAESKVQNPKSKVGGSENRSVEGSPSPQPSPPGEGESNLQPIAKVRGSWSSKPPGIKWRPYQRAVIEDHSTGILILHWGRQLGKSFTLAGWAVERLLTRPGRLVTVLSNSRENGAEFVAKCAEICRLTHTKFEQRDKSPTAAYKDLRMEVRIRARNKWGRIKVLAANPRTARGFSGDLILDEFAFHEDAEAIWAAAEPILSSNPDFLCRIASTGNGKHNLFYRMVSGGETRNGDTENLTANEREGTQMGDEKTNPTTDGTRCTRIEKIEADKESISAEHPMAPENNAASGISHPSPLPLSPLKGEGVCSRGPLLDSDSSVAPSASNDEGRMTDGEGMQVAGEMENGA